jgi:hypothetical protein
MSRRVSHGEAITSSPSSSSGGDFRSPRLPAVPCCAGFRAARRPVEVVLGRLGVVLQAHLRIVFHPHGDDVNGELLQQLGLAARPQVVEEARPRLQPASTLCRKRRRRSKAHDERASPASLRSAKRNRPSFRACCRKNATGFHPDSPYSISIGQLPELSGGRVALKRLYLLDNGAAKGRCRSQLHCRVPGHRDPGTAGSQSGARI